MISRAIDMTGKKYSSITAIRPSGVSASRDIKWLFLCDCGVEFEANGYHARTGKITTCPKCASERSRVSTLKHGLTGTVEFSTWTEIKTRCYNKKRPEYKNYGGRGIKVCERWLESFENFLLDMGPRPDGMSIDRKDNDGDYSPENCQWSTRTDQANNKRNNHKITIDGITKNRAEWAKEYGISSSAILLRERSGLSGRDLIKPSKRIGTVTFNGKTKTYEEWSKVTGIKPSTIAMRINTYKWPIEKALTEGVSL